MPALPKSSGDRLLKIVEQTISDHAMLAGGENVLLGISGGADSVALFHILRMLAPRLSLRLGIAHLDHCLRGPESDRDAAFVKSLAEEAAIPFYLHREAVEQYRRERGLSLEEAARQVRYAFLEKIAREHRFDRIAVGHQAEDDAELVLMNLFRGSGTLGVSGIPPVRGGIIRPLIRLTKEEIFTFLRENSVEYRIDSSNSDLRHLRNRIRRDLLPTVKARFNPRITEALNRFSSINRSEDEWIEKTLNPLFEKTVLYCGADRIELGLEELAEAHPAVKRRLVRRAIRSVKGDLRRIGFDHIERILRILEKPQGAVLHLPGRIWIDRKEGKLTITREKVSLRSLGRRPEEADRKGFSCSIAGTGEFSVPEIGCTIRITEIFPADLDFGRSDPKIAYLDLQCAPFPFELRHVRPGDRFAPFGMTGTQKVSKFLAGKKISRKDRAGSLVLTSGEKIVWLVGHRIDEGVRVSPTTRSVLKIELFLA